MSSRAYSILWCMTYYFVLVVVSICQPFIFDENFAAGRLSACALALPPAYWMIRDAKLRGTFVPHIVQPWIVLLWSLVVPIYLLVTRRWWGLLYVALHCVCIVGTSAICQYLSIYFLWPVVFPESAW